MTVLGPDSILLTDRVAVVTGAAAGIGRATAVAMARFGCHLALCDRDANGLDDVAAEIGDLDRRVVIGVLDVRDGPRVAEFLEETGATFGRVDVLVNNAGGGFFSPFMDVSQKGQDALVAENFTSVTHFVRGAVPLMPETGGVIVNITSIEAHRAGPGFAVYSAMKAGVENLTRSLALELSTRHIRVYCIAPDAIPTPGDAVLGEQAQQGEYLHVTPLLTDGHPDDVAAAAVFLASPMARFMTGTTLHVDGGNDAARGWRRQPDGSFKP